MAALARAALAWAGLRGALNYGTRLVSTASMTLQSELVDTMEAGAPPVRQNFNQPVMPMHPDAMPRAVFPGRIHIVKSAMECDRLIVALGWDKPDVMLGFDTETKPSFKAGVSQGPGPDILQLASGTDALIYQLAATNSIADSVRELFHRPDRVLLAHSALNDLNALFESQDLRFSSVVDIQKAAFALPELFGTRSSLCLMTAVLLGAHLSKNKQLTDWSRTELSPGQQLYAASDAWVTYRLGKFIESQFPTLWANLVGRLLVDMTSVVRPTSAFTSAQNPDNAIFRLRTMMDYYGLGLPRWATDSATGDITVSIAKWRLTGRAPVPQPSTPPAPESLPADVKSPHTKAVRQAAAMDLLAQVVANVDYETLVAFKRNEMMESRVTKTKLRVRSLIDVLCLDKSVPRAEAVELAIAEFGAMHMLQWVTSYFFIATVPYEITEQPNSTRDQRYRCTIALPRIGLSAFSTALGDSKIHARASAAADLIRILVQEWPKNKESFVAARREAEKRNKRDTSMREAIADKSAAKGLNKPTSTAAQTQ
eukprot:c8915_g1_i2.p1 GENE.c8915_g1_i2~~c8915_g1_i2.p1  ORF type:complete len:547 (+),score=81.70 c8915_g1_i2:24-1643(+)